MGPFKIRAAIPADRNRWDELWQGYLVFYKHQLAPEITEITWNRLLSDDPATACLIAADANDHPQGFAHIVLHPSTWSQEPYCYLEDLFVEPELRASGVGRALIEEIYRRADQNGWPYVYWKTQENNYRARGLYDQVADREEFLVYARQ